MKMYFYDLLAQNYEELFPLSEEQVSFVYNEAGGKNVRILDAGCGTGSMDRALWKRGCRVTGIDANERMIEEAHERMRTEERGGSERKAQHMPRFLVMDMLRIGEYFEEDSFDSFLSLGNTLVHLSSVEEIERFLREVGGVLRPGGRLLPQIRNHDYILDDRVSKLPLIETHSHRFHRSYQFRENEELLSFRGVLEERGSGLRIESVTRIYPLRSWQLKELLESSGFLLQSEYGSFSYGPAGGRRLPYIVIARKKRQPS